MESLPIIDGIYQGNEGLKLEFKSALKGIPKSIWDTYSAFANTVGGRIIIGINDESKEVEGVPKSELRIQELWNNLNNSEVVNHNILSEKNIWKYDIGDKTLRIIDVPQADRYIRPIFHRNLDTGTFKRNGEGDYRCKLPEIASMLRDQSYISYDSTLLEESVFEDIDMEPFPAYRNYLSVTSPDHPWRGLSDEEFAKRIGAVGVKDGKNILTVAGLLMFGKEYVIYRSFPNYKLDYQEYRNGDKAWIYRLVTGDGTWEGNVFNYFVKIANRLTSDLDRPLVIGSDMRRIDDTDDRKAVRECLLNSLIHADYFGNLTVKVVKRDDSLTMSNSGIFRIPLDIAKGGGESDPRNGVMAKMFSMIGMVERAGVGVNMICNIWMRMYGVEPLIIGDNEKDTVTFELQTCPVVNRKDLDERIIAEIMKNPRITIPETALRLGVSVATVSNHLRGMRESGRIRRIGGTRGHWEIIDGTDAGIGPSTH